MPEPERVKFAQNILEAVGLKGTKATKLTLTMEAGLPIVVDCEFIVVDDMQSLRTKFKKYIIDILSVEDEGDLVDDGLPDVS